MGAPLIVFASYTHALDAEAARLREAGWVVIDGFALPERPWRVSRVICRGTVATTTEAQAVALAAARGAGVLVALAAPSDLAGRLYEDLQRLGRVELRDGAAEGDAPRLPSDQRRILELLASGSSLDEIASELGYSRRTIHRRLQSAREGLGVRTTAEAIRAVVSSRS